MLDKGDSERDIFKGWGLRNIHMERYVFPEKAVENLCMVGSASDPYVEN